MALPPTDKRAATDEAFLREVDDAVRAGDLESFWNRFGRWLVAAVVIGLIAIVVALFSALVFLYRDRGHGTRMVKALAIRVGLSILLVTFLIPVSAIMLGTIVLGERLSSHHSPAWR